DELGDNAPGASQDVAEADGDVFRPALRVQVLDVELGHALACSHDARWAHGLVRGNENEFFDAVFFGQQRRLHGPANVVFYPLEGILFHDRNVLVGRRVKDDGRLLLLEDALQASLAEDIDEPETRRDRTVRELLLQRIEVELRLIDENEPTRAV